MGKNNKRNIAVGNRFINWFWCRKKLSHNEEMDINICAIGFYRDQEKARIVYRQMKLQILRNCIRKHTTERTGTI